MALARSLYSTQFLKLYLNESLSGTNGTGTPISATDTGHVGYNSNLINGLPVQSASIERTVPTENILVLGKLGSLGRQQKEIETVKMDVKLFWASGEIISGNISPNSEMRLSASNLQTLTGNALQGKRSIIAVEPNGFTGYGILTNFAIDAAAGDFLTASMSFAGFGKPFITTGTNDAAVESDYAPKSIFVYTSENVSLAGLSGTNETIKTAKFSIDLPNERLSRIGAPITGYQTDENLTANHLLVAKPPFKVTVSYDGEFVTGAHSLDALTFGHIKFTPVSANITSQNYSQKAGDVGASMSFSSEGTSCSITDYHAQ